ncbi:MAG: hypothetical protein LKJ01_08435 [Lactobacillus sp.]|jgi:hypothetical protein|nr:hypothetical protein [Lactobacillus sp.]MCI2037175.1 hypothetical protein [Lactobacillus sp.]
MTETKQQVFNAAVEKAVGMTLVAGYTSYGDKYFKDMQKRYDASSDGDPECLYCHTPSGREATKQEYINDYMVYEATGDPVDTLDDGMLAGIICCQWCGRRLEA